MAESRRTGGIDRIALFNVQFPGDWLGTKPTFVHKKRLLLTGALKWECWRSEVS